MALSVRWFDLPAAVAYWKAQEWVAPCPVGGAEITHYSWCECNGHQLVLTDKGRALIELVRMFGQLAEADHQHTIR